MAIISLKAALDTLLACLNHFPLFALMLRIKDSQRLPGILLVLLSRFLTNEHKVAFVLNFDIPNNFLVFPLIPPLYRQPRTYFSK
jgi:hypothetical protein